MPLPPEPKKMGDIPQADAFVSSAAATVTGKAPASAEGRPKKTTGAGRVKKTAGPATPAGKPSRRKVPAKKSTEEEKAAASAKEAAAAQRPAPAKTAVGVKGEAPPVPASAPEKPPAKSGRLRRNRLASARDRPRIFVLDTNVLLHDPSCLFRFKEHDVFLPMTTLEELDNHKTGTSDIARNARQVSRWIDQLAAASSEGIVAGIPLSGLGSRDALGRLFFQTSIVPAELPAGLPQGLADNMILGTVMALAAALPEKNIVLVSKDINMRIKAAALGLTAEDYFSDKTIDDTDLLYSGRLVLPETFWEDHAGSLESWREAGETFYRVTGPLAGSLCVNQFVATADASFAAQVRSIDGNTATFVTVRDYMQAKNSVWGIRARNMEQSFAFCLLMNPDIDFVTLLGQAGTGKTLMTLAAALTLTLDERRFTEIIFTRATVSVGEEIGFLPGTEEEKMLPWMGALEDNLDVLNKGGGAGEWGRSAASDIIRSRIRVKSMSFMRGRTFLNKFVIIDEAQNLSPKQMKTLITRAGPGTKIVCLGNIAQIDTPYLSEGSSGLTYVVDRFRGWKHAGHITLQRVERSRLADHASEIL